MKDSFPHEGGGREGYSRSAALREGYFIIYKLFVDLYLPGCYPDASNEGRFSDEGSKKSVDDWNAGGGSCFLSRGGRVVGDR